LKVIIAGIYPNKITAEVSTPCHGLFLYETSPQFQIKPILQNSYEPQEEVASVPERPIVF